MGKQLVDGRDRPQWRELGQRLARTLSQSGGSIGTPARLQGLVADLAADRQELLLPLKDLVSRPAFQALIPKAGSGSGAVQRDGLIQAMEATFSRQVIQALRELLDGFLDLPPGSGAQAVDQPDVPVPQPAAPPPAPSPPRPNLQPAPAATPLRRAEAAPLVGAAEPRTPVLRLLLLSLATAVAVVAGAAAVVVLRTSDLCALVGLCPSSSPSNRAVEALAAAEQAAQDLNQAGTLRAYERAVEELEQQLLTLSAATLTPEQEQRRQRLDQTARDARGVLAEERNDARRLEKASKALAGARQRGADERAGQLAIAREELDAIAPRSFSAAPARTLRRQLEQLEAEAPPSEPSEPEAAPDPVPGEAPAAEQEPPAEQPAPPPPPLPALPRERPTPAPIPPPPPPPAAPGADGP
jgi:hypothetical protein